MKTNTAPCYNCRERSPGCHGTCELYKLFRIRFDEEAAERDRARAAHNFAHDGITKRVRAAHNSKPK